MKSLLLFLLGVCWLLQVCEAAPARKAVQQEEFNFTPDPDSLVELTHWTTQGFQETGITNKTTDSRVVFALAPADLTIQAALNDSSWLHAPVVFVTSKAPPKRRKESQAFMTVIANDGGVALSAIGSLPITILNKAAPVLEKITGRRLYPIRVIASNVEGINTGHAPFIIYDVSRGDVHVSQRWVEGWADFPEVLSSTLNQVLFKDVASIQKGLNKNGTPRSYAWMEDLVAAATATITSGAMSTIFSKPPLWFCFVCPIVLGEFFPFFFNLGLGEIAQLICDRYHLPDEECLDLWLGAIALALVLSLSSVVAIVSICRIKECASPKFH